MAGPKAVLDQFKKLADRAYNSVYQEFQWSAQVEGATLKPSASNGHAFVALDSAAPHRNSIEVHGALRLENLPRQRTRDPSVSKHEGGISVLMSSLDIYKFERSKPDLDESFLYSSNVRLGYYRSSKDRWIPLLCVRYDFAKSHAAHPLFHAQLEDGMPNAEVKAIFPDLPKVTDPLQVHTNVRLPTANVVGATALLSLAADHLPLAKFPDILRAIRKQPLFSGAWRCECTSMDDGALPSRMLSSCWYSTKVTAP